MQPLYLIMAQMVEQYGYPHEGGKGISFYNLGVGTHRIQGQSGALLEVNLYDDFVAVHDLQSPLFQMYAKVESSELYLGLWTKRQNEKDELIGEPHPDMYAQKFIDFALCHFRSQGTEINSFSDSWGKGSINYQRYLEILQLTNNRAIAAKSTWGSLVMGKHGFVLDEDSITHSGKAVHVSYTKKVS